MKLSQLANQVHFRSVADLVELELGMNASSSPSQSTVLTLLFIKMKNAKKEETGYKETSQPSISLSQLISFGSRSEIKPRWARQARNGGPPCCTPAR